MDKTVRISSELTALYARLEQYVTQLRGLAMAEQLLHDGDPN